MPLEKCFSTSRPDPRYPDQQTEEFDSFRLITRARTLGKGAGFDLGAYIHALV